MFGKRYIEQINALLQRVGELLGENRALRDQNKALQVHLDWFKIRTTQLERERAQLLYKFTDVKVEVPDYTPTPPPSVEQILNESASSFEDMGDEAASRAGIGWNEGGQVVYGRPKHTEAQ